MEIRSKEELFEILKEESWRESSDEVFVDKRNWASIGDLKKMGRKWNTEGLFFDTNKEYEFELERDLGRGQIEIGGSKFRKVLIVRVLGYIIKNKKKRLTLKSDNKTILKKYDGEKVKMEIKYIENSSFYPIMCRFLNEGIAFLISPVKQ